MAKQPPALSMSQIIASDAPLLSPVAAADGPWDPLFNAPSDAFAYSYYSPLSPASSSLSIESSQALKMRGSPVSSDEQESLCMPTHQVFDLGDPHSAQAPQQSPVPPPAVHRADKESKPTVAASTASKRSASPSPDPTMCKKRATNERVSSKDFIPPDVTGLSKREARLVKNRAAAFLSRQRKREEFETMEVYVI